MKDSFELIREAFMKCETFEKFTSRYPLAFAAFETEDTFYVIGNARVIGRLAELAINRVARGDE